MLDSDSWCHFGSSSSSEQYPHSLSCDANKLHTTPLISVLILKSHCICLLSSDNIKMIMGACLGLYKLKNANGIFDYQR